MTVSSIRGNQEALFKAVNREDEEGIKILSHSRGGNSNLRNASGDPLIVYIAKRNFLVGMQVLFNSGTSQLDINAKNKQGEAALHIAAWQKNIPMIDLLLQQGASRNIRNQYGDSILHIAANAGDGMLMEYLLSKSPFPPKRRCAFNLNAINQDGETPLLRAGYRINSMAIPKRTQKLVFGNAKANEIRRS